jgi:hypothetical protein
MLIIFLPLIIFAQVAFIILEKSKLHKCFVCVGGSSKCCNFIINFLMLPWDILVLAVMVSIAVAAGAITAPFAYFPTVFLNTRYYFRSMCYWSRSKQFKVKKQKEGPKPK